MKSQRMSQLEKFNAKYGKNAADNAVEAKQVEERIAAEMEQKKDLYNLVGVLSRSVELLTSEVRSLRRENDMLASVRDENVILNQQVNGMNSKLEEMHKMIIGMSYMSSDDGAMRTVNNYKSMLHRWRAEQIKKFGDFMDPPVEMLALMGYGTLTGEDTVAEEEEVIPATPVQVQVPAVQKGKAGRPPGRVTKAKKLISENLLPSGRFDWKKGGIELVFAIFTLAEHKEESLSSSSKNVDVRKAYQQVAYNKDQYGVAGWADLLNKYNESKEAK